MKVCNKCFKEKELSDFGQRINRGKLVWQTICRECRNNDARIYREKNKDKRNAATREWGHKNPERKYQLNFYHRLKNIYNMTVEDYESMALFQDYKCAICGRDTDKRKLAVDHDHETGKIRGLLCNPCNRGLGFMRDDLETVKNAVEYLEKYKN